MYDLSDPVVVQKYGGTSVGDVDRIRNVANRVKHCHEQGVKRLAVVVSAMAGETNRLVGLVAKIDQNARSKIADLAVSAGEQVSVALLAAALESEGIKAEPLLGFQLGIRTNEDHAGARIRRIDTARITRAWDRDAVPIVAGFQGVTEDFSITTLGRGGSDTSAVAIAAALKADLCEINTDVDGFYSADPRVVKGAKLIAKLDFEVAMEMASLGSKVLHHRCVELAAKYDVPLVVRNTFNNDPQKQEMRTTIMHVNPQEALEAPVVSGVSVDKDVARIAIGGVSKHAELITRVFTAVAKEGINVDIIVHNRLEDENKMRLGFTVSGADLAKTLKLVESFRGEDGFGELNVESEGDLAKVSVVGLGMRSHHGVASKTFACLTSKSIDIKMISTSEIKISCVVPKDSADKAAKLLHEAFV